MTYVGVAIVVGCFENQYDFNMFSHNRKDHVVMYGIVDVVHEIVSRKCVRMVSLRI